MSTGIKPHGPHFGLILPLCTSSATVGLALFQYPIFSSFFEAKPSIAGKPLSRYWEPFIKSGGSIVALTALTTTVGGVLSMRWLQSHGHLETTEVAKWYGYGSLFAVLHFAFVPLVASPIRKIVENKGDNESAKTESDVEAANREAMKSWFQWHTVRTVLVDLPALWCFAEGIAMSFWVI